MIIEFFKKLFGIKKEEEPHIVLYEEVKPKPDPCSKHIYYRKSCPVCRELRQAGAI